VITVRVHARYAAALEESAIGISLQSKRAEVNVFSTDTTTQETPLGPKKAGEEAAVDFTLELPLQAGTYTVDAAVSVPGEDDSRVDEAKEASSFKLTKAGSELSFGGMVRLPTRVEIHEPGGERERPTRSA